MNALHICEASEFGALTACGRCALTWETRAETRPPCKPKAHPPISLNEMIDTARGEGQRALASQRALVAAAMRSAPYMPELRKASLCFAIANLLERVRDNPKIVDALKGGG